MHNSRKDDNSVNDCNYRDDDIEAKLTDCSFNSLFRKEKKVRTLDVIYNV